MRELKDFILVVPNAMSKNLRAKILQEYENSNEWTEASTKAGLNKEARDVSEIRLSASETLTKNNAVRTEIDKEVFACASLVLNKYQVAYEDFTTVHVENDEGYALLRYKTNQFYKRHLDDLNNMPRTLSCSFAINDDYEGGEWSFFDGSYVLRLNAGDAILFPSNFLYPHSILPVVSGARYSVITWFR